MNPNPVNTQAKTQGNRPVPPSMYLWINLCTSPAGFGGNTPAGFGGNTPAGFGGNTPAGFGEKTDPVSRKRYLAYSEVLSWQRQLQEQVIAEEHHPVLLFLEHEPVITISRRKSAPDHLLTDAAGLKQSGIKMHETDRGGDITYHGPGQLVVYPIIPIVRMGMTVGGYMRFLEQWVIDTLAHFQIVGELQQGMTGVWVEKHRLMSKIAALGVRVRKGVAMHGLALNVSTCLSHFEHIVPCGLENRNVTRMQSLMDACPDMREVIEVMLEKWQMRVPGELREMKLDQTISQKLGIN